MSGTDISNVNLANRRAIIWDFDGVFYDFDAVPEDSPSFYDLCDQANATTTCSLIDGLDYEEARRLARDSFDEYNDPVTGLLPLAKKHGYSEGDFTRKSYYGFNELLPQLIDKHCPNLFQPCVETIRAFLGGVGYVRHGILTHSCTHRWANPVLNIMKKVDFFDPQHVMGFEDFDFKPKGQGVEGLSEILGRLKVRAGQAIFVEDTLQHLQVAKSAYPDLITVLKSDQTFDELPEGVDMVVCSAKDLMNNIILHKRYTAYAPMAHPNP